MQRYIDKHIKRSSKLLSVISRNGGSLQIDVKKNELILKPTKQKVENVAEITNN